MSIMRKVLARRLALGVLALAVCAAPMVAQTEITIEDTTVLSMTGDGDLEHQTVMVRDGLIFSITDVSGSQKGKTRRKSNRKRVVIDGSGKFLIPGLIDAHVHIGRVPADMRRLLDLFLLHGVTTVISLEGKKSVLEARDRIQAGDEIGPTIVTSGPIVRGAATTTEAQGRRLVEMQVEAGYDLIKVYNPLSEDGYRGVIDEARKRGIPVAGHAVRSVGIEGALAAGQHIVHMEEMVYGYFTWKSGERDDLPEDAVKRLDVLLDEGKVPELAARVKQAGIWVTPNLVAYYGIVEQTNDLQEVLARPKISWMPDSMQRFWQPEVNDYVNRGQQDRFQAAVNRTYPFLETLTRAFDEAGVPLLAGTDVGIPVVIAGDSLHRELELLVDAGLSETAALVAATRSAADFLGRDDLGRITSGAQADLILLSADPRQEISHTRKIEAVIVAGRLVDREAILAAVDP